MFLRLTVKANYLDQNHWFTGGAFTVNPDMRSHMGAYMTLGTGMVGGSAKKQKINTTSSTEAEVVEMYENMPTIMRTQYFLEAQGYLLKPTRLH